MWTFDEAMEAVTALQPETRDFGYHLAMGGGVLNNGASEKDLDLYFLPLDDENIPKDSEGLLKRLEEYFGEGYPILQTTDKYPTAPVSAYTTKRKFVFDDRRIDAFIL